MGLLNEKLKTDKKGRMEVKVAREVKVIGTVAVDQKERSK